MAYQVGQAQFEGHGYVTQITPTVGTVQISTSEESANSTGFKDVIITPSGGFDVDTDYYLSLSIPRDINYASTFNIKLVKSQDLSSQSYQFIKQVTALQGGNATYVHPVALYCADGVTNDEDDVRAMIPRQWTSNPTSTILGDLYYNNVNGTNYYYLGTGYASYVSTDKVNLVQLSESWRTEDSGSYATFDMVFRPVESGFTSILLEMVRSTEDYAIQRTVFDSSGNTVTEYGRIVDTDRLSVTMGTLTNIVTSISGEIPLNKIGVWGHPRLLMSVNGEEIRIGPSGYYEEDVIDVSSLGIVSFDNDYGAAWTLDYTYDINYEEESD